MDEEILFPRGKPTPKDQSQKVTSKSHDNEVVTKKKKRARSDSGDFLFGGPSSSNDLIGKKSKSKKRDEDNVTSSSRNDNVSMMPLGGGAVLPPLSTGSGSKRPALIESLSFSKLSKGMKLLGMIREVSEEYAVISLPNMWTGFLVRKQNGVPLTRVVSVNQVLPVIVQKTTSEESKHSKETPKRRIELSVDPIHINMGLAGIPSLEKGRHIRGVISSCEDHGCLVDIGIPRVRCFLSYDKIEGGKYRLLSDSDDDDSMDEGEESDDEDDENETTWKLNKGRVYDFTIESLPSNEGSGGIIQLRLQRNESRCKYTTTQAVLPSANPTLRTLLPGMLVTAYVEQHAKNGLCVSFLNNVFRGSIDMTGIGGFYSPDLFAEDSSSKPKTGIKKKEESWLKNVFSGKFRFVKARIIVVDHVSKIIRLSLQPHVLHLAPPKKNTFPPVGTVIENAKVIRLDSGIGALLALPPSGEHDMDIDENEEEAAESRSKEKKNSFTNLHSNSIYAKATSVQCCYVHISKAMDDTDNSKKKKKKGSGTFRTPETLFAKHFSVNTTISKLRILNTSHWMDNIASCATAESIVSAAVLSHSDIMPSAIYKSVPIISSLSDGSVLVQLGIGVKGIVPNHHLFDKAHMAEVSNAASGLRNNSRMDKYKVGNMIDVRCLTVSFQNKKCVLTAKKSMLASDLEDGTAIINYGNVVEGQIATGFISKVDKTGIYVTFYNNVYGRVSARRLAEELGVEDPTVNYTLGDVAKARVVRCFKMNVSQDDDNDDDDNDDNADSYYSLELSLNISAPMNKSIDDNSKKSNIILKAGAVLPAKSMKIVELIPSHAAANYSSIKYVPGYAIVSIKSKFLDLAIDEEVRDSKQSIKCKLPFDQLLDHYDEDLISTSTNLDTLSMRVLKVGKKIAQKSIILTSGSISRNALPIVSLRADLIETAEEAAKGKKQDDDSVSVDKEKKSKFSGFILPSPSTSLFVGAYTHGYCIRHDPRYGAFIRFLDNLTGLVPKVKGGLDIPLFDTVYCKVIALDVMDGKNPKILLKQTSKSSKSSKHRKISVKPGDLVGDVKLEDINFARVKVSPLQKKFGGATVRARIHVTMAEPTQTSKNGKTLMPLLKGTKDKSDSADASNHEREKISQYHPFHSWKIGGIIKDTICISVDERDGIHYLELTNRNPSSSNNDLDIDTLPPVFVERATELQPGTFVTGVITSVSPQNKGIWVQVCPGVTGFISGLELSQDASILNKMSKYYKVGGRISCCVMENPEASNKKRNTSEKFVQLSSLMYQKKKTSKSSDSNLKIEKPVRGDVVIARVNRFIKSYNSPSLMLDLRGNYQCRCDVTEIDEVENWVNMPFGRVIPSTNGIETTHGESNRDETNSKNNIVTDEELENGEDSDEEHIGSQETGLFRHGTFVKCCILSSDIKSNPYLEVSLRQSRIDGNLDNMEPPKEKELIRAFVVSTTKKGCFVRLSRTVEGRVLLKELSDSFLPSPVSLFPPGRLVVGKVKAIRDVVKKSNNSTCKFMVDLDMRESKLLENQDKVNFKDIEVSSKYRGVVTRVESYGVFIRLENSDINGLAHISECSDDYVKSISSLYDPGDLVKVKVVKIDNDKKQISLSLKASHFEDDSDSDDDSSSESSESDSDSDMLDIVPSDNESDVDSDDENFASKLAAKMDVDGSSNDESSGDDSSESESSDDDSSSSEDEDETSDKQEPLTMDTDVGFDWGTDPSNDNKKNLLSENGNSDSSADESSDDEEIDTVGKSSHKSRKKAAAKRQTEREILVRESALADGTADENPETTADFERILASDPNSSENYIRYMAYHLSLADIESARNVADRAFNRIEFRQEGEKLNVWTALLTLEMKYGNKEKFNDTVDRACQHNNPKQVYLRVCEMLEREIDKADQSLLETATSNADEMFSKMCKKFKSKKTVWISHLKYLLKSSRHEEAHKLLKRSLTSLPEYKHTETITRFAQQEYEHGSVERARTIFDALVEKQKKRLDLLFVYVDKEIKHGDIEYARNIFEKISTAACEKNSKSRFSDKQMKGLFKKWYRMEDEYGDDESKQNVKLAAKAYVEQNSS